jgi:hypothetical protein
MENARVIKSAPSHIRTVAYWITTGIIILETAFGSMWDLTRNQHVQISFTQLGYPVYLLTILGFWKLLAAIALIVPNFLRVKEWAYAGLFFEFSGATASHLFMGQITVAIYPFAFACILIASCLLRPASRKLGAHDMHH